MEHIIEKKSMLCDKNSLRYFKKLSVVFLPSYSLKISATSRQVTYNKEFGNRIKFYLTRQPFSATPSPQKASHCGEVDRTLLNLQYKILFKTSPTKKIYFSASHCDKDLIKYVKNLFYCFKKFLK